MSSIRESNRSHAIDRFTGKFYVILRKTVVLVCVLMPVWLQAQQAPCNADILKPQSSVCTSSSSSSAPPSGNVTDRTKSALSCAWIDPDGAPHVLEAFGLLTSGRPFFDKVSHEWVTVNKQVLDALIAASRKSSGFFGAALGNLNEDGEPTAQGLPDLVDIVSKTNTRGKVDSKDEMDY